jgi:DNA polymerase-3 subunit alpha
MQFIHLRVHSAYSLAEGAVKVKKFPKLCIDHHMPAIGITDTNNLFGALEIASCCANEGIQAIMGIQIDLNICNLTAPLVLFAQSEKGYRHLLKLASHLYAVDKTVDNRFVTLDELQLYNQDLICLTGGHKGPVGQLLLNNKVDDAKQLTIDLKKIFNDKLYIELQRHGLPEQAQTEPVFLQYAYDLHIPLVATNDVFFENKEMYEAHDALLCIAEGRYVIDENRRKATPQHYFKSQEEMVALFQDIPEAISNTAHIAKRVHFTAKSHPPILPRFETDCGRTEEEELKFSALEGLEKRLTEEVYPLCDENQQAQLKETYLKRLDYELDIINKMGFPGYFLIVADFIRWAKKQEIPVGPGRGSGAGSLVAWVMTITDMDPIRFGLIFERFLNPERVSMPDFDIDFCQDRRDEVIQYVSKKYGLDQVAHIITFGKLQARAVLRDVGRVLQIPYGQVGKICDLVPNNPASPVTLAEAIESEPLLQNAINEDENIARLVDIGKQLEGLYRHASTHAAGIVIGDRRLDELVPIYRDDKSELSVTQFNMKYVENAGLVKFDFLGLKTLTVIECASQMVRNHKPYENPHFKIQTIPLDDKKTFDLLCRVETVGIFQLESSGMKDIIKKLKPDQFENLIALVALYRPGPMDDIPRYLACKNGETEVYYLHPKLKPILSPTFGVMVYQEQVMHIAQILGGYSLGAADLLRRAMGKKIKSEMDAQRTLFTEGAIKNDVPPKMAREIFDQMAKFAGYGFNKSHSAPYGLLAYQTAYLKANYPLEFFASSMTYDMQNTDKLNIFRQDIIKCGYKILPPDVNYSYPHFTVDHAEQGVRYALAAIKNAGEQIVDVLVQERLKNGLFKSIDDFVMRVDVKVLNKRLLENLITAGAFDSIHKNRRQLFDSIDMIIKQGQLAAKEKTSKQASLFSAPKNQSGTDINLIQCCDFSPVDKLAKEFNALGFYLTAHPLDMYKTILPKLNVTSAKSLNTVATEKATLVNLAGVLLTKQEKTSKSGKKFAFVQFSDTSDAFECVLFAETLNNIRENLIEGRSFYMEASLKKDAENDTFRLSVNMMQPLDTMIGKGDFVLVIAHDFAYVNDVLNIVKHLPIGDSTITLKINHPTLPQVIINLAKSVNLGYQDRERLLSMVAIS